MIKKGIFLGVVLLGNYAFAQTPFLNPIVIDPQQAAFAENAGFEAGRLLSVSVSCHAIDATFIKEVDRALEKPYKNNIYNYPYQKGLKRGYLDKSPNGSCSQAQIAIDSIIHSK